MTATVFLHRIGRNLIDASYMKKLDDFDWLKRMTGCSTFLFGPKESLLEVAITTLAEADMIDN